jgi:hypothetical protein
VVKSKLTKISLISLFLLGTSSFIIPNLNNVQAVAKDKMNNAQSIVEKVKNKVLPDDRIGYFNVTATEKDGLVTLTGKVLEKSDKEELLKAFSKFKIKDQVKVFPFSDVGEHSYGVANTGVMQIRDNHKHSAQLVTQGLFGMTMKILGKQPKKDEWVLVSMDDDKYIGWVRKPDIWFINKSEYDSYKSNEKVMISDISVNLLNSPSNDDKSDIKLYMTTKLNLVSEEGDFYKVKMPGGNKQFSGKEFYVSKDKATYLGVEMSPDKDFKSKIVVKAKNMISAPYLWGGASPAMMDCSGYTQMLYRLNGFQIPRDADQQQAFSKPIKNQNDLQVGDLVFFSENKKYATHVGMYIGDKRFIHSSVGYGGVAITSFDPKDPLYNPVYQKIYFGAGRVAN